MQGGARVGVLFVCLGNICRSPIAEGIFLHLAQARGVMDQFDVDSAGMGGWHAGQRADPRALAVAARHDVVLPSLARQIDPRRDWARFHHVIAMDRQNQGDLIAAGRPHHRVRLLRSFDPDARGASERGLDVPDPYSGPDKGFDEVFAMSMSACTGLLDHLLGSDANLA